MKLVKTIEKFSNLGEDICSSCRHSEQCTCCHCRSHSLWQFSWGTHCYLWPRGHVALSSASAQWMSLCRQQDLCSSHGYSTAGSGWTPRKQRIWKPNAFSNDPDHLTVINIPDFHNSSFLNPRSFFNHQWCSSITVTRSFSFIMNIKKAFPTFWITSSIPNFC